MDAPLAGWEEVLPEGLVIVGRFTLVQHDHSNVSTFPLVIVNELLLELETGTNISRSIGSGGGADDDGICDMVTHMRKVLTHGIEHQDGEEIFFLQDPNGICTLRDL